MEEQSQFQAFVAAIKPRILECTNDEQLLHLLQDEKERIQQCTPFFQQITPFPHALLHDCAQTNTTLYSLHPLDFHVFLDLLHSHQNFRTKIVDIFRVLKNWQLPHQLVCNEFVVFSVSQERIAQSKLARTKRLQMLVGEAHKQAIDLQKKLNLMTSGIPRTVSLQEHADHILSKLKQQRKQQQAPAD